MSKQENILEEAARIVDGDRQADYGDPTLNHGRTAMAWTAYLMERDFKKRPLDARDVCTMMVILKTMREAHKPKRDNLVDMAGWARNAEIVTHGRQA